MLLLDRTVAIYRLTKNGNLQSYSTLTTTLEATIQPISEGKVTMAGSGHGKMFVCYLEVDKDVIEGDEVRDRDGNIYKIIAGGIERRNDGFLADHLKITMQKTN